LLRIQFVKIMEDAADSETLVVVQGVLENGSGDPAAVEHKVFANDAAGIGEAIGELFVGGKQKEPRSLRTIRAHNDGLGFLEVHVALFVEVGGADDTAGVIRLDAMHVRVRANFAAARALGYANGGNQ